MRNGWVEPPDFRNIPLPVNPRCLPQTPDGIGSLAGEHFKEDDPQAV